MDNTVNVRTGPVDPQVKTGRRIGDPLAFQRAQVVIDPDQRVFGGLVEA
jgi:hypothetical protein